MKAYVFDGKDTAKLVEREKPEIINQSDVIVKIEKTTICGTDLHILRNNVKYAPVKMKENVDVKAVPQKIQTNS